MYYVRHWLGKEEREIDFARFEEFLSELLCSDNEHSEVSLRHESEWVISYSRKRTATFENVELEDPASRCMFCVDTDTVLELWRRLAVGDFEWLEQQPWEPCADS